MRHDDKNSFCLYHMGPVGSTYWWQIQNPKISALSCVHGAHMNFQDKPAGFKKMLETQILAEE